MTNRIKMAADKGCDAVDPDNMDGYTQDSGFKITAADQLKYNRWIANLAHEYKMAVGLKNDVDQIKDLVSSYDFAVNEQCFQYNECEKYGPFSSANKAIFNV
jgi:hypothetical protein